MAALFSDNFDLFLHSLRPHAGPTGQLTFPVGLPWDVAQVHGNETPGGMLARCVNDALGGDVRRCAVEADLAVLAFIRWRDGSIVSTASIQAINSIGTDIQSLVASPGGQQAQYFRLDIERRTGMMFTHPFPHVHYVPRAEIRYSLNGWKSRNVVIDFFEHIYVNCYHASWLDWAEGLWNQHWGLTGNAAAQNPFQTIVAAFRESQYPVLEQYEHDLQALKNVLRRKKDDSYRLRVDDKRCSLLAYPGA